jgi:zinc/manganese transport system permease protein
MGYHFGDTSTFLISLAVTFLAAALFSWTRNTGGNEVPQEAIIGITFVVAAAAVILVLSRVAGGKEELEHLLTGDILNVTSGDVARLAGLFAVLGGFYTAFHRRFALVSENAAAAAKDGLRVRLWDFLFYVAFALVVVSFVRIAGVLLTFAYLIVPAVCATMLVKGWRPRLVVGWITAAAASLIGLSASYWLDLPTGAAIVVACGLLLVVATIAGKVRS